jgi:hypothetical protein
MCQITGVVSDFRNAHYKYINKLSALMPFSSFKRLGMALMVGSAGFVSL